MADPDLELRGGPGFVLLALPAFLPSVISSSFIQNRWWGGDPDPSPRSATVTEQTILLCSSANGHDDAQICGQKLT